MQAFKESWLVYSIVRFCCFSPWDPVLPRLTQTRTSLMVPVTEMGSSQNSPLSLHTGTERETKVIFPAALSSSELGPITGVVAQYFRLCGKLLSGTKERC